MNGKSLCACALALALSLTTFEAAQAHGLIGKRFFPATLAIDDPFVSDELSLPTLSYLKLRGTEEAPPTNQFTLTGEFSKRLTPDLGISLGGSLIVLDPDGGSSVSGFFTSTFPSSSVSNVLVCTREGTARPNTPVTAKGFMSSS